MTGQHFVRTGPNGRVVHKSTCRHARAGAPWLWAENRPEQQILATVETMNYQLCKRCKPLAGVSTSSLNGQIAAAITDGLLHGLPHPDNPDTALVLAQFRTAGLPEQIQRATTVIAETVGSAIVDMLEQRFDAQLVPNAELAELRRTQAGFEPETVSVECQHGELFRLALTGDRTRIDCVYLRRNLIACTQSELAHG